MAQSLWPSFPENSYKSFRTEDLQGHFNSNFYIGNKCCLFFKNTKYKKHKKIRGIIGCFELDSDLSFSWIQGIQGPALLKISFNC